LNKSELYINYNGELITADAGLDYSLNRAFLYGDGLFESMHAFGLQVQLFDLHHQRLAAGMKALKLLPDEKLKKESLHFEIDRLLKRNKYFGGTRVRLTVFRKDGGLYSPETCNVSFVITANALQNKFYKINEKGYTIDIFTALRKSVNYLSPFKTCSSLMNVMAGIYCSENQLNDCLLLNEKNRIIESYHSNIFIVKDNILYTPDVDSGCIMGVMRETILGIAKQIEIKVVEVEGFVEKDLLLADEIFLTNAIEGIRWVLAFKNRRYYNRTAALLNDQLNTLMFSNIS
jgi:branched-chain amino acid aminotransferase